MTSVIPYDITSLIFLAKHSLSCARPSVCSDASADADAGAGVGRGAVGVVADACTHACLYILKINFMIRNFPDLKL